MNAPVSLLDACSDCFVRIGRDGRLTHANAVARGIFGWADGSSPRPHWLDHVTGGIAALPQRSFVRTLLRAQRWEGECTLRVLDGQSRAFQVLAVAEQDETGRRVAWSLLIRDVEGPGSAFQRMQRQAAILQAVGDAIPATVVVVDRNARYRFANSGFERYCGRTREQIIGQRVEDILGEQEVARRRPYMTKAYAGDTADFVLDYPSEQGTRWLALTCIPIKVDGVVDGFVGISRDVTRDRRERDRLIHLAERDALTGLLNRAGLERCLERLSNEVHAEALALLYVDLDRFKPVNDTHGHLAGDKLLQQFAQRLLQSLRNSDVAARVGGDEFVVVLPGVSDHAQAQRVADKVRAAASEPFAIDGAALCVTASVGMAVGLDTSVGWRDLVARADAMMYRAKTGGRDNSVA